MMMMIPITLHDSIKPAGLVRRELPNLSESSLAGPNGPRVNAEAEDRSHPAKLDSDKFGDEAGETKPVA